MTNFWGATLATPFFLVCHWEMGEVAAAMERAQGTTPTSE